MTLILAVLPDRQGHLGECGDKNIYNLSQLPMLQGYKLYNRSHTTSFRLQINILLKLNKHFP